MWGSCRHPLQSQMHAAAAVETWPVDSAFSSPETNRSCEGKCTFRFAWPGFWKVECVARHGMFDASSSRTAEFKFCSVQSAFLSCACLNRVSIYFVCFEAAPFLVKQEQRFITAWQMLSSLGLESHEGVADKLQKALENLQGAVNCCVWIVMHSSLSRGWAGISDRETTFSEWLQSYKRFA